MRNVPASPVYFEQCGWGY